MKPPDDCEHQWWVQSWVHTDMRSDGFIPELRCQGCHMLIFRGEAGLSISMDPDLYPWMKPGPHQYGGRNAT